MAGAATEKGEREREGKTTDYDADSSIRFPRKLRPQSSSQRLIAALQRAGHVQALPRKVLNRVDHTYVSPQEWAKRKSAKDVLPHAYWDHNLHPAPGSLKLKDVLSRYFEHCPSSSSFSGPSGPAAPEHWQQHNVVRDPFPDLEEDFEDIEDMDLNLPDISDADGPIDSILEYTIGADDVATVREPAVKDLPAIFNAEALDALAKRGYDASDVITWAWIITAPTSLQGAMRLVWASNSASSVRKAMRPRVPLFVLSFLLRRKFFEPSALRILVLHVEDRLLERHNLDYDLKYQRDRKHKLVGKRKSRLPTPRANYPRMEESGLIVVIVRLLRHARRSWPESFPGIVSLFTTYMDKVNAGVFAARTLQRWTFVFNRLLSLVSHPTTSLPFRAVPFQQRAQFHLLQYMDQLQPPLHVTREGFRATARVQLSHRLTSHERQWDDLKALSWPPWKVDRLGTDESITIEAGISRARSALNTSMEAGYQQKDWEKAATVMTGWDTDDSPTIQTRAMVKLLPVPIVANAIPLKESAAVWEARIRATRTVTEAWAIWLSVREAGQPLDLTLSFAMLQRLVLSEKEEGEAKPRKSSFRRLWGREGPAGGGLEPLAPPSDPRQSAYVRVPPPRADVFLCQMVEQGLRPRHRMLDFLLRHTKTFAEFRVCLRSSDMTTVQQDVLLGRRSPDVAVLRTIHHNTLASVLQVILRVPQVVHSGELRFRAATTPLKHALELLRNAQPRHRRPWAVALQGMGAHISTTRDIRRPSSVTTDVAAWETMLELLDEMHQLELCPDYTILHALCRQYAFAVQSLRQQPTQTRIGPEDGIEDSANGRNVPSAEHQALQRLLGPGLDCLRRIFASLVQTRAEFPLIWHEAAAENADMKFESRIRDAEEPGSDGSEATSTGTTSIIPSALLPRIMEAPPAATLHVLVRALGTGGALTDIVALLRWMAAYAPELEAVNAEMGNGVRWLRRTLVAARVFLENRVGAPSAIWQAERQSMTQGMQPAMKRLQRAESAPISPQQSVFTMGDQEAQDLQITTEGTNDTEDTDDTPVTENTEDTESCISVSPNLPHEQDELVAQAKAIVEGVHGWGGWPTEMECDEYLLPQSKKAWV